MAIEKLRTEELSEEASFVEMNTINYSSYKQRILATAAEIATSHFPDEVKIKKELLQRDLTEEEYQSLYKKLSNKHFFFDLTPKYSKLMRSCGDQIQILYEAKEEVREFFNWVKEGNWEKIDELKIADALAFFTSYMDYKGRTPIYWAHQLGHTRILSNFSIKIADKVVLKLLCKIAFGQLKPQEISKLENESLTRYYPLVIRYSEPELIKAWISQLERRGLRTDIVSVWRKKSSALGQSSFEFETLNKNVFQYAGQWGRLDTIKTLRERLHPDHIDLILFMLEAVTNDHYDVVKYILNLKVININYRFKDGSTFLHAAGKNGHFEMMRLLTSYGAIYAKNNDSHYPTELTNVYNDEPEFKEFNRKQIIKSELLDVLKRDPAYLISDRSLRQKALALYGWYARQAWVNINDSSNSSWCSFHRFSNRPAAKKIHDEIENLKENFTQACFQRITADYTAADKTGHFEGIKELIMEGFSEEQNVVADNTSVVQIKLIPDSFRWN